MANILLIDLDSKRSKNPKLALKRKMPNLALMKISAYHKSLGDRVYLNSGISAPDKVYVSCIFKKNAWKARALQSLVSFPVEYGGYGINDRKLPADIEHTKPDYELYGIDYSMGFTSRGCIRHCPWCIVPEMEGQIRDHASIWEFLEMGHSKLILLDNNFLASPRWEENLSRIIDHGLKVNFNQGLDIRCVDERVASLLAETKFYNWHFKYKQLHFAWDDKGIYGPTQNIVRKGIDLLENAGIKPRYLMFYMLVGFGYNYDPILQFREEYNRFKALRSMGVDPYVMKWNFRKDIPILNHFARYVNKRIYTKCNFEDYDYGDSKKVIATYRPYF